MRPDEVNADRFLAPKRSRYVLDVDGGTDSGFGGNSRDYNIGPLRSLGPSCRRVRVPRIAADDRGQAQGLPA